jgi:hypothetical protein
MLYFRSSAFDKTRFSGACTIVHAGARVRTLRTFSGCAGEAAGEGSWLVMSYEALPLMING